MVPVSVSGALAERFSFGCYMIFSIFNTLIYCVPVHWLWSPQGWLNKLGAIDIGGSGVSVLKISFRSAIQNLHLGTT